MDIGKIKILHDRDGVYRVGEVVNIEDLFGDFAASCQNTRDELDYLYRIPIPAAVDYIANAWGIDYKFT